MDMMRMEARAYAKINWDLHVLGRRPDGFHALDTVMVNVNLYDLLKFSDSETITLSCSDPALPTDERNLVMKAALALAKAHGCRKGVQIELTKHIPSGGGMGGGSSDAACTLIHLNRYWNLGCKLDELHAMAAQLGSDVPFFLYGGWRRCLGRGEIVETLQGSDSWPPVHLLLVLPPLNVPTPLVYKSLRLPPWDGKTQVRTLTDSLQAIKSSLASDPKMHLGLQLDLVNDLTGAARAVEPRLAALQHVLERRYPGRWLMSGSGAVHFSIAEEADDGSELLKELGAQAGPGIRVLTTTTFTPLI